MWQESFLITLFVLKKCGEIQTFCEIFDFFENKNGHHIILVSIPPLFNIKFLGFKLANNSEMGQLIKKVYIDKPPLNGPKYLKISFKSCFEKFLVRQKSNMAAIATLWEIFFSKRT